MKREDRTPKHLESRRRREYVTPRVEETVEFETLALACDASDSLCGSPEIS